MKKFYIVAAAIFSAFSVAAQPQFTGSDIFNAGSSDSFKVGVITDAHATGLAMEHNTGTSNTWDFETGVVYLVGQFPYTAITATASMYSYFPAGSNLRESCPAASIENLYEKQADTLYMMRNGSSMSTGLYMLPKLRYLTFPLNFGDSLGLTLTEYADTGLVTASFTRTHSYMYDGYGTVKLPWGTYSDILRIKLITRDSSHIISGNITTKSVYFFFRRGGGMPIVKLSSTSFGDSVSHGYSMIANKSAMPTAVPEISTSGSVHIYPNPATESLYVSTKNNTPFSINIMDMTGKNLISSKSVGNLTEISLNGLSKGMYLVVLANEDGSSVLYNKFVKTE